MADKIEVYPSGEVDPTTTVGTFTATDVSRQLQIVGRQMLGAANLLEITQYTFSTCTEPIEHIGERLIRARDIRVPLVEVTVLPEAENDSILRKALGVNAGILILDILRSDGVEKDDRFWGKIMEFQSVGLSIPGYHEISLNGDYGREISAVLTNSTYSGYGPNNRRRDLRPAFSGSHHYEEGHTTTFDRPSGNRMREVLVQSVEDFITATGQSRHGNHVSLSSARAILALPEAGS